MEYSDRQALEGKGATMRATALPVTIDDAHTAAANFVTCHGAVPKPVWRRTRLPPHTTCAHT
eukprot:917096-Prymnesium_polylepis.1